MVFVTLVIVIINVIEVYWTLVFIIIIRCWSWTIWRPWLTTRRPKIICSDRTIYHCSICVNLVKSNRKAKVNGLTRIDEAGVIETIPQPIVLHVQPIIDNVTRLQMNSVVLIDPFIVKCPSGFTVKLALLGSAELAIHISVKCEERNALLICCSEKGNSPYLHSFIFCSQLSRKRRSVFNWFDKSRPGQAIDHLNKLFGIIHYRLSLKKQQYPQRDRSIMQLISFLSDHF